MKKISEFVHIRKPTERLQGMTEKIDIANRLNIGEKFDEIKEKISNIRNH